MTLCLTSAEVADLTGYDWFYTNHERFLWTDEAIEAARMPFDVLTVPHGSGVYFLFREKQLAYVGQSNQLRRRLYRHAFPQRTIKPVSWLTHYAVIPVPREFLDTVESFFIHLHEPPLNERYWMCPEAGKYLVANEA